MRTLFQLLIFCCCAGAVTAAAAQEELPYLGYVTTSGIEVHAGPGSDYYATDRLEQSTRVEVYRRGEDGWLAIRPPAGSFSWVRGDQLQLTDEPGVAEVVVEDAVAWVGSRLPHEQKHKWQVQLRRGELVEILAQRQTSGDGDSSWYRISPPAGEFRWIHSKYVSRHPPHEFDGVAVERPRTGERPGSRLTSDQRAATDGFVEVTGSRAEPAAASDGFVARDAAEDGVVRIAADAIEPTRDQASAGERLNDRLDFSSGSYADRLKQLDLALSLMVAKPSDQWQLGALLQQAERLVQSGRTTVERGRATMLVDKIREFQQLEIRREQLVESERAGERFVDDVPDVEHPATDDARVDQADFEEDSDDEGGSWLDELSGPIGSGVRRVAAEESGPAAVSFDGSGWLMPVHSRRPGAPQYALTDDEGNVKHFVSPAPGLNLHRYLRKEVGVFGRRGYLPSLRASHITVERLVDFERHPNLVVE